MGRLTIEAAGFTLQTVRFSAQPLERWITSAKDAAEIAAEVGGQCVRAGMDYCSLGTIQAQGRTGVGGLLVGGSSPNAQISELISAIPDMLLAADNVYTSIQVGDRETGGINLDAVRASAAVMKALSEKTANGFGNLRFAAAANCPPHVPFFPVSYYTEDDRNEGAPEFGLALEAADLAVQAFSNAGTHEEARENLLALLIERGDLLAQVCGQLAASHGYNFTGLDISMAPFPETEKSIGRALELISGGPMGGPGTLAAATFFTGILKEARRKLPTVGYSGLMLPVLEDQTLADRVAEGLVNLDTMLLLSAVCGLGIDTIPLPGDISVRQLEKIILDMASLAIRLDKPLSARLFPVPGKAAGEPAEWPHFAYFARGRVMDVPGRGENAGLFRGSWLEV